MNWRASSTIILVMALCSTRPAGAGPNSDAKILLHVASATSKNQCDRADAHPSCASVATAGNLYPSTYFVYLLVAEADSSQGVAGLQCGITYNNTASQGVDIYSWHRCADLAVADTDWPQSGTSIQLTWENISHCQRAIPGAPGTGVVATAGYFYCSAYSADTFSVTKRAVDDVALIAGCTPGQIDTVDYSVHLGYASFSTGATVPGYNPCGH